ncbi:hypothetical protein IAU60_000711 [Kwoniella sp. DSM 27419]
MTASEDEAALAQVLKRLAEPGCGPQSWSLGEITLLANSLLPTSSRPARSLAHLCLAKYSDGVAQPADAPQEIYSTFQPYVESTFSLSATNENPEPESCVPLACLLGAIFPLAPEAAVKLVTEPVENVGEPIDIMLEVAELPSPLQPALAEMLIAAAGTKKGREMVRTRALHWLKGAMHYERGGSGLGMLCAVALSKLSREEDALQAEAMAGNAAGGPKEVQENVGIEEGALCHKMMAYIEEAPNADSPAVPSAMEGLAVLSLRPRNRHILAESPSFLKRLVSLAPVQNIKPGSLPVTPRGSMDVLPSTLHHTDIGLCYGLTTVLVNLTSPKPVLSAEDQQLAKLRAMAISGNKDKLKAEESDELEGEAAVQQRTKAVIRAGAVAALTSLAKADSRLVKEGLGRLCRNLVEDQADRLIFVRDGGFKVLSNVVRDLLTAAVTKPKPSDEGSSAATSQVDILPAFQALAKMTITTPPHLLFPPPHTTTALNALTPLYHLLTHPSSTTLQRFESLMALTNIASIEPSIASRIVLAEVAPLALASGWQGSGREDKIHVMVRIEELMLDDNDLVRRAACQLVCNLISSDAGYEYFSGETSSQSETTKPAKGDARVRSRLHILLIMCGVDDLPTRLAAGGGLAVITESPNACAAVLPADREGQSKTASLTKAERTTWSRILDMLDPEVEPAEVDENGEEIPVISSTPAVPNLDLVHRAVIILLNLVTYAVSLEGNERSRLLGEIRAAGVTNRLLPVLRMRVGEEVLQPAVECLKLLKKAEA